MAALRGAAGCIDLTYRVTLRLSGQRSGLPDLHSSSLVFAASSHSFYLSLYCDHPLRFMIHVEEFYCSRGVL